MARQRYAEVRASDNTVTNTFYMDDGQPLVQRPGHYYVAIAAADLVGPGMIHDPVGGGFSDPPPVEEEEPITPKSVQELLADLQARQEEQNQLLASIQAQLG